MSSTVSLGRFVRSIAHFHPSEIRHLLSAETDQELARIVLVLQSMRRLRPEDRTYDNVEKEARELLHYRSTPQLQQARVFTEDTPEGLDVILGMAALGPPDTPPDPKFEDFNPDYKPAWANQTNE